MDVTTRLEMPLLAAGQAQKELWHNEALQIVDVLVAGSVEDAPSNDPPISPSDGAVYIVGSQPTGLWEAHADHLAAYGSGGWRFILPAIGTQMLVKSGGVIASYRAAGWELGILRGSSLVIGDSQVVGPQADAIDDVAGGTTVDFEARSTLGAILAVLRQHGLISQ